MVTGKPLTMSPAIRRGARCRRHVGLGTGTKIKSPSTCGNLQLQNGIVQLQGGPTGPLVYPHVYAALEDDGERRV
jgi:hypothetical protein